MKFTVGEAFAEALRTGDGGPVYAKAMRAWGYRKACVVAGDGTCVSLNQWDAAEALVARLGYVTGVRDNHSVYYIEWKGERFYLQVSDNHLWVGPTVDARGACDWEPAF